MQLLAGSAPTAIRPAHVWASPWSRLEGFRLNTAARTRVNLRYQGERISVEPVGYATRWGAHDGDIYVVFERGEAYALELDTGERNADEATVGDGAILSPMPGKIVSVAAKAGAKLKKGDPILVLEAMKMEHTLTAPFDGKVVELTGKAGDQVAEGVVLAKIEAG